MNRFLSASIVAAGVLGATSATAATTVYSDAAAFTAATTGVTTNGFNTVAANSSVLLFPSGVTSYAQPGFAITQSTNNAFNSNGNTSPSTFYYYNWGTDGVVNSPYAGTMTVTFSTAVTAFALDLGVFYGAPFPYPPGTVPGAATTLYGQPVQIGTSQGNFSVGTSSTRSLTFFGVTSDTAFTSFTIKGLSGQAGASTVVDNLRFGTALVPAVPEPASWGMMILGFGIVGGSVRYRRRKTGVAFA